MKTLLLLLAGMGCMVLQAQPTVTKDQLAFEYALSLYEDERFEECTLAFYEFMAAFPNSPLRGRAHYNLGLIQFQRQHWDAAAAAFKEILAADYNELDANSLMEPYALYKHQSCRLLAEIRLEQKDYKAAEEYIRLFEDVYPYQHFCGNELTAYAIYLATMKAHVYEGQQKIEKAIRTLVPFVFDNALASNTELLDLLINILYRHYGADEIRHELNTALATIDVKKGKRGGATMMLYGEKVDMNSYYFEEDDQRHDLAYYQARAKETILFTRFL
ncbi:MAG: tetratricopeptide repeat protein [Cyclobacteriaceae bacterium]